MYLLPLSSQMWWPSPLTMMGHLAALARGPWRVKCIHRWSRALSCRVSGLAPAFLLAFIVLAFLAFRVFCNLSIMSSCSPVVVFFF
jgi:hypothetical protein